MENWSQHRDTLRERFASFGSAPDTLISNSSGSIVISHASSPSFKGRGSEMPYAALGLCTEGGGRTRRETEGFVFDDVWRPGKVGLMLPGPAAEGFCPEMKTLTIAFDIHDVPACHGEQIDINDLNLVIDHLVEDELISAVMVALLRNAEAHGAASAFFDHGLSLILHRLVSRAKAEASQTKCPERSHQKLAAAFELIQHKLSEDLRVAEMAQHAGLDSRSFTRNFKLETGYTPYQYLTRQRMNRAKLLLKQGESVTNTAISVGYANPAKFSAAFRRWVGKSPTFWKRHC